ncbi:hypothetical protein VTN77DRAFT_2836 [Rasamsonia byssochlamydoides]|uniref:uncharacterized protein n=1 Tax=Rasamsonia byssochlamydoides TaxID=89139 RepID=UPI003743CEA5
MERLPLLRGRSITLEDALEDDDNILARLDYPKKQASFWSHLSARKTEIEAVVWFHLGVEHCRVSEEDSWLFGSYNVCIPVYINRSSACDARTVLVRIPLPFKVGEAEHPGNVDEKLRCEVATYIWMQENCPDVPIPSLFGFGFPDGQTVFYGTFTRISCHSVPMARETDRPVMARTTQIMVHIFVTNGRMLSESWRSSLRDDQTRRLNLFRDLSRIMLSLSRMPLPRIGSLTLDNHGVVRLTNRPLTLRLQTLENEGIPTTIPRESTYSSVEPYLLDLLGCHDSRIYHQPNSIHSLADGEQQLALTTMRAVLHHFTSREYRNGPFVLTLTDLHQSNIFVDDEWHITSLVDLEWACSFPIELQCPPYWLSGRAVDDIEHGEPLETFGKIVSEFINIFEEQEREMRGPKSYQAPIMRQCWDRGSFWYFQAVHSPEGLYRIFNEHTQ